jgi:hypothetical protein
MATFDYTQTQSQDDMIDLVEFWADKVTATNQTIGLNRDATYRQMVQAMRHVLQRVPLNAVKELTGDGSGQSATNNSSYTEIVVPEDLLTFLNLKLSEWDRPVHETIDPRSNQHRLQYNSVTSGDRRNPVVANVAQASAANGQVYRCWPQDSTPTIDEFNYLPETAPEEVPDGIKDPIITQSAAYVLTSQKEGGVETMFNVTTLLINNIRRGEKMMVQEAMRQVQQEE